LSSGCYTIEFRRQAGTGRKSAPHPSGEPKKFNLAGAICALIWRKQATVKWRATKRLLTEAGYPHGFSREIDMRLTPWPGREEIADVGEVVAGFREKNLGIKVRERDGRQAPIPSRASRYMLAPSRRTTQGNTTVSKIF